MLHLFADELPTSTIVPGQAVTIVIVLWTMMAAFGVFATLIGLMVLIKRKPPIEAEFATKKEMAEGFARVDRDLKHNDQRNEELAKQIFTELKSVRDSINHELQAINRSLGKLEGEK